MEQPCGIALSRLTALRASGSRWVDLLAVALLLFSAVLFAWIWITAWRTGAVPDAWGAYTSNHGPWRHRYDLRDAWWLIVCFQSWAFVVAFISYALKPNAKAVVIAWVAFVAGWLFSCTHFWLVD